MSDAALPRQAPPGALQRLREAAAGLPREARDTWFHLAVVAWTIAPHALRLPLWCGGMAAALLAWRAWLARRGGRLPSRWVVAALLALATGLTWWGERTLLGKEAGITLLVVLMSLKTLELRARRDALVVFFLGFFLVLTHFLYSQSLLSALWLLAALWGLLASQVLAHMPVGRPPLRRAAAVAARLTLLGLPLMLLLFLLFPRIGPLWGLPQDAAGRTGLSGTLRLGGVAQIAEDDAVALRIRFFGPVPPPAAQYFRGPVLSDFDGREWTRLRPSFGVALRPRLQLEVAGAPLRYEMTVEPSRLPLLPLLEMTPDDEASAPRIEGWLLTLRPDGQWQTDRPLIERQRVSATAYLQHRHGPGDAVLGLRDLVRLPPGYNPRLLQWVQDQRATPALAQADAEQLVDFLLRQIRDGGYGYTLEPGPYGRDAIDEFWFDRKLGFCEHFATAFVVALRAFDVPARVVTGYQGMDPVAQDGYWVVRQRNAHAWAEYWRPGQGWVRVDPTAAVAPDRVLGGRRLAPPPGVVAGALANLDPALAERLRNAWEVVNNRWNQWVLNYSRGAQLDLLRRLGWQAPSWQDLATLLVVLLSAAAAAGAGWAWWDRRRQDPWQRLQLRVQRRLAALGVVVQAHEAPRTRAAQVRAELGERGAALADALDALDRLRYADAGEPGRAWWRGFARAAAATAAAAR